MRVWSIFLQNNDTSFENQGVFYFEKIWRIEKKYRLLMTKINERFF